MSEEYKVIHANVYDPTGFHLFGKPDANRRAESQVIRCKNSENCELFKRNSCVWRNPPFSSYTCPYGNYQVNDGYTKRAKNFSSWIWDERKKYEGVPHLQMPTKKLAIVGDYIYFPYAHANMNKEVPFLSHSAGGFGGSGSNFIPKEHWTKENILKLINFRPQALFGGTIHTYFSEEIPLFFTHFQETMPEMYAEFLKYAPSVVTIFKLDVPKNYVGRKAKVKTLAPCTFRTRGSRDGDYKVTWVWDGKVLKTTSSSAYHSVWGDVKDYESLDVTLTPNDNSVIEITDNAQVNSGTEFVD